MADHVKPERNFNHPYVPYPIQLEFMNALYDAVEDGCVGIFESPTGTGKSLSLLCGSLTWLRNHKSRDLEEQLNAEEQETDGPSWVYEHSRREKKAKILRSREDLENRLNAIREKETREKAKARNLDVAFIKKLRRDPPIEVEVERDDQFILEDYYSDDEHELDKSATNGADGFSSGVKELMQKLGMSVPGTVKEDPEMEIPDETKIFFCSRTHSQLSQFVNELRRVNMPSYLPTESLDKTHEQIKHLSLGSRKNLCINLKVTRLGSLPAINEKCQDMQQTGTNREKRCEFLPTKDDQTVIPTFRDNALASIRDIEDLAQLGRNLGTCPYYASRSAIKPSEIVTLPYPLLLQRSAREALDISLKGNIVIIDEAHNLIDAISSIHSVTVTLPQLHQCKDQLGIYLSKFRNRLKGSNKVYIMKLSRLLDGLALYLEELDKSQKEGDVQIGDLLAAKGIDQINFFKLQKYLATSKLPRKLENYLIHSEQKKVEQLQRQGRDIKHIKARESVPVLTHIQGFLLALTNPSGEGKIFHGHTDTKEACFKYMLLDPAFHFKDVVAEARAVILAGGTMQPMQDYITHLFPYVPREKIRTLSCGHVIPKDNLLALPLIKGPTNREFEFTFDKRMDVGMIEELGRALCNLCVVIPDGVVCFFPSYTYLDFVISQWRENPSTPTASIWGRLSQRKQLFQESSEKSSVEETLAEYSQAIDSGKGALLFSVVGGKMSEGINFNDRLGRGIIMVGLPFPNAQSAEWRARIRHVEQVVYNSPEASFLDIQLPGSRKDIETMTNAEKKSRSIAAGKDFYENACMRAVNQSIGRAIRHREDYAAIILIDKRYTSTRIQDKLPGWIKTGLVNVNPRIGGQFADAMKECSAFFRGKNLQ